MSCVSIVLLATILYAVSYVQGWSGPLSPKPVTIAGCSRATSNRALTPSDVTINVYNATARAGLATSVAASLQSSGFKVAAIGNDPLVETIPGVAEIRYGHSGLGAALLAAEDLAGAKLVQDTRIGASVDIVLGNSFSGLSVPSTNALSKTTPRC